MAFFGVLLKSITGMARGAAKSTRAAYSKVKPKADRVVAGGRAAVEIGKEVARAAPLVMTPGQGPVSQPPNLAAPRDQAIVQTAEPEVAGRYPGTKAHAEQRAKQQDQQKQWARNQKTRMESGDLHVQAPEAPEAGAAPADKAAKRNAAARKAAAKGMSRAKGRAPKERGLSGHGR